MVTAVACESFVGLSRFWHPGRFPNLPSIAMIQVYCDESHDEATYGLAGWIASPDAWDKFSPAWQDMLLSNSAPVFHAVEIVERDNISDSRFKGWTFEQEKTIFGDALDLLQERRHNLVAIGCSVSVERWQEWIDSKDTIWLLLFSRMLHLLVSEMFGETHISLMFDSKKEVRGIVNESYYNAREIVDRHRPGQLADVVAFGEDEKIPPLQAADLFAYEWRKRSSDKVLRPKKVRRRSYERLRELNCELRHYDSQAMIAIREKADAGESLIRAMWDYPTTEE